MEHQTSKVPHPCSLIVLSQNTASFSFNKLSFVFTGQFLRYCSFSTHTQAILLINLSHHEVVLAKSVIDTSMASLLASIKIIFVEKAIPFFLWSIIQFLTYSSSFGHLGAHERKVFLLLSALIKYFLCFLHSRIIFSVGGEPKCLSVARFPCFSA